MGYPKQSVGRRRWRSPAFSSLSRGCAGFVSVCSCETVHSRAAFLPQTAALVLAARPRLRMTRSEIAIHEFGHHHHDNQSKNPAHHTTGSKLKAQRAVWTHKVK